jgi:hypothetical protein
LTELGTSHLVLRRRDALRAALAVPLFAVAGCSSGAVSLDLAQRLRARALVATRALISQYESALLRSPTSAGHLAPTLAEHRAHFAALAVGMPPGAVTGAVTTPPQPSASATATSTRGGGTRPAASASAATANVAAIPMPPAGATAATLERWFASRERATSAGRARDILAAPGNLARLLASVAACEAALADLLAAGTPTPTAVGASAFAAAPTSRAARASASPTATPTPLVEDVTSALTLGTALQRALAAEYAAVYGYGVLGARLSGAPRASAANDFQTHRARRDQLIAMISARRLNPVAAAPVYALPFAVSDAASARRLAAYLETRASAAYADLAAVATGSTRKFALGALTSTATTSGGWSGTTPAFPGLPELGG